MKSHRLILLSALALVDTSGVAAEDNELADLLALLEQETELATSTRMNADYVPGMVTVLYGQDARLTGKKNVAEALEEVAGFYLIESNNGDKRAIVRGVGATQNASNLKLLVDGVAVNRATDGSADWVMRMPLSQVDRIEVVRGPGSAIHGGFAFSGVVNIISRDESVLDAGAASHHARQWGLHYQYDSPDHGGDLTAQLNLVSWQRGDSGLQTGQDNFSPAGYSPATVYDHEQGKMLLAGARYQTLSVNVQHVQAERGPGYGYAAALPEEHELREETYSSLELGTEQKLVTDLILNARLVYQQSTLKDATYLPLPAGVRQPGQPSGAPVDVFRRDGNEDSAWHVSLDLRWQAGSRHLLFSQLGYSHLNVDDAFNVTAPDGGAIRYGSDTENRVEPGASRQQTSLTLQDQWQAAEHLDVTVGLRHDRYSDWGFHTSPRLALVWRAGEHHILKAQYAEAFRPPTLKEANPGEDSVVAGMGNRLNEEVLRSSEAAYLYRAADHRVRLTLFYTQVSDLIEYYLQPGEAPRWRNRGDISSRGAELEWQQQVGRDWEWRANASYTQAKDHLDDDSRLLGAVDWLANTTLVWNASSVLSHSLSWQYVGQQEGWELGLQVPQQDRYPAYTLLHYGLHWKDALQVPGLLLTLAGRNLGDVEYRTTASPPQYPQGLPHGRRAVSLALEYAL